jgi:hypothetical protein
MISYKLSKKFRNLFRDFFCWENYFL